MDKRGCISEFRNAAFFTAPRSRFLESMVISATIMIAQAVRDDGGPGEQERFGQERSGSAVQWKYTGPRFPRTPRAPMPGRKRETFLHRAASRMARTVTTAVMGRASW